MPTGDTGQQYATLTDIITQEWSGMTTRQYKNYKGLKKENLRDHMTRTESALNTLAEVAATELSQKIDPKGFSEQKSVAKRVGETIGTERGYPSESQGSSWTGSAGTNRRTIMAWQRASSKTTRSTCVDIMAKYQIDMYAAGLHRRGSKAVERYTNMEIRDDFALRNFAFRQKAYKVDKDLNVLE